MAAITVQEDAGQEAPPLAASLRAQTYAVPKSVPPATAAWDPRPARSPNGALSALGKSHLVWHEDSELKRRHRELTKEGLKRARKLGKRLGRPPVTEREGFAQQFAEVVRRMGTEGLTVRQAARELAISSPTLKRLLNLDGPPDARGKHQLEPTVPPTKGAVISFR